MVYQNMLAYRLKAILLSVLPFSMPLYSQHVTIRNVKNNSGDEYYMYYRHNGPVDLFDGLDDIRSLEGDRKDLTIDQAVDSVQQLIDSLHAEYLDIQKRDAQLAALEDELEACKVGDRYRELEIELENVPDVTEAEYERAEELGKQIEELKSRIRRCVVHATKLDRHTKNSVITLLRNQGNEVWLHNRSVNLCATAGPSDKVNISGNSVDTDGTDETEEFHNDVIGLIRIKWENTLQEKRNQQIIRGVRSTQLGDNGNELEYVEVPYLTVYGYMPYQDKWILLQEIEVRSKGLPPELDVVISGIGVRLEYNQTYLEQTQEIRQRIRSMQELEAEYSIPFLVYGRARAYHEQSDRKDEIDQNIRLKHKLEQQFKRDFENYAAAQAYASKHKKPLRDTKYTAHLKNGSKPKRKALSNCNIPLRGILAQ